MKSEDSEECKELTEEDEKNLQVSSNPASFNNFTMTLKEVLRAFAIKTESVMPAQIVSYDRNTHTADVKLLVKKVFNTTKGVRYKERFVMTVPVLRMQHGMFTVDAPLYPGDTGYVIAGHRDGFMATEGNSEPVLEPKKDRFGTVIDSRTNNVGPQPPNTYLLHRYENGFFIPCRWGSLTVDEADADSLVIARLAEQVVLKRNEKKVIDREEEKAYKKEDLVYKTVGYEGKVAFEKDGTIRVRNGTGLIVESDEYRDAMPGEKPDKVTDDGRRLKRKPKAVIDPTGGLELSDAFFRKQLSLVPEVDAEGKVKFLYRFNRVLADEGDASDRFEGYSGERTVVVGEDYNQDGEHKLILHREKWTYRFGLLVDVAQADDFEVFQAVPHVAHD